MCCKTSRYLSSLDRTQYLTEYSVEGIIAGITTPVSRRVVATILQAARNANTCCVEP
jgi:hypothetical protein